MPREPELTDIEKSWLVAIDALLTQTTANAHAMAAGRMVDLWETGGVVFQHQLGERAAVWRRRHALLTMMVEDGAGPCHRLIALMERPSRTPERPKRPRRDPSRPVRPSHRGHCHRGRIRDAEVEKFMALIEEEGISVVFDPGVSVTTDDVLFKPPLITLDGVKVFYEQIAPVYEGRAIERAWDPARREPPVALALDLVLLVIRKERKWTWQISDRYLSRLPWGHPCKTTPAGRPGWGMLTKEAKEAGLIESRRSQTWRMSDQGKQWIDLLAAAWKIGADQ